MNFDPQPASYGPRPVANSFERIRAPVIAAEHVPPDRLRHVFETERTVPSHIAAGPRGWDGDWRAWPCWKGHVCQGAHAADAVVDGAFAVVRVVVGRFASRAIPARVATSDRRARHAHGPEAAWIASREMAAGANFVEHDRVELPSVMLMSLTPQLMRMMPPSVVPLGTGPPKSPLEP